MGKPFTRAQALQNAAFLERLALSANVRLAAREVGVKYSTVQHRRATHAEFAQRWEAVLAPAQARFHLAGGKRGPECSAPGGAGAGGQSVPAPLDMMEPPSPRPGDEAAPSSRDERILRQARDERTLRQAQDERGLRARGGALTCGRLRLDEPRMSGRHALRTKGGEAVVVRGRTGKLQLRLAHPGKLTKAAEQAFLAALSASANIRLSAAAAGASPAAFYRRRKQNPAFDREFRLALAMGYERLEAAALRAAMPESHADDRWRHSDPPPIPPMTADQVLQLLHLHEKSVRQGWERPHRRRRRGESDEVYVERLRAMWTAEKAREAEEAALRRAARYEETGGWRFEHEAPPPALPPLHLVTGWSKADPGKKPHNPDLALFGGWRIREMRSSLRSDASAGARKKKIREG